MGEIADMMLNGTLCVGCGIYIGSDSDIPTYCSKECAKDHNDPGGYVEEAKGEKENKI